MKRISRDPAKENVVIIGAIDSGTSVAKCAKRKAWSGRSMKFEKSPSLGGSWDIVQVHLSTAKVYVAIRGLKLCYNRDGPPGL